MFVSIYDENLKFMWEWNENFHQMFTSKALNTIHFHTLSDFQVNIVVFVVTFVDGEIDLLQLYKWMSTTVRTLCARKRVFCE